MTINDARRLSSIEPASGAVKMRSGIITRLYRPAAILAVTVLFSLLAKGQTGIVVLQVTNPTPVARPIEMIEVKWADLPAGLRVLEPNLIGVYDRKTRLRHQTIDLDGDGSPDQLLFQSAFRARQVKRFVIRRADSVDHWDSVTDAKFAPPRNDVAWENDRIAFRIYGGPLAGDVRSGLDVWVKRVRYHIIDEWYAGDSLKGLKRISYHVDHGEGGDFFNVGKSLGAGGCALLEGGSLRQSGLFENHRIIATGPIRAMFRVRYGPDSGLGPGWTEELTYSLDAGDNLNRIDVKFSNPGGGDSIDIAAGLVYRPGTAVSANPKHGWMSLWGPMDNDSSHGSLGTGIVFPATAVKETLRIGENAVMVGGGKKGMAFTYYAGAGWTRSGDFSSSADWKSYLERFARRILQPLKVKVMQVQ